MRVWKPRSCRKPSPVGPDPSTGPHGGLRMDACGELQPNDCKFEHWQQWSHCDAPCGKGTRERVRDIAVYGVGDGKGCEGATQEVSACELQACEVVDCKWSAGSSVPHGGESRQEWYEWSVCSASCDGGTQRRERNVAVAPQHGGKLCSPLEKSEMMWPGISSSVCPMTREHLYDYTDNAVGISIIRYI